ncbi:MAG: hypothetical protein M1503_04840 [Thaumarchaeota archaeon]|nr:hypothetical protein [Nitrososphaerota archaeon]MCL5317578.1 hypothetical protein [Nitrososphaerota archaeon]
MRKTVLSLVASATILFTMLLLILFISDAAAMTPSPPSEWDLGKPFSPTGFVFNDTVRDLTGNDIPEFNIFNGTSASVKVTVKPTPYVMSFPLKLNLTVGGNLVKNIFGYDSGPVMQDVQVSLPQNPVIIKSADDQATIPVAFTAKADASANLYRIHFGRRWGASSNEGGGYSFYIRVINGHQVTTTTTTTSTTTFTVTQTVPEMRADVTVYAWAIGATVALIAVMAALLSMRIRSR